MEWTAPANAPCGVMLLKAAPLATPGVLKFGERPCFCGGHPPGCSLNAGAERAREKSKTSILKNPIHSSACGGASERRRARVDVWAGCDEVLRLDKLTTSSGGSLGSWVDEDRSKMRVSM